MSKDMDLITETASEIGVGLPAGRAAKSVLDSNLELSGDLDVSAITPFVLEHASQS